MSSVQTAARNLRSIGRKLDRWTSAPAPRRLGVATPWYLWWGFEPSAAQRTGRNGQWTQWNFDGMFDRPLENRPCGLPALAVSCRFITGTQMTGTHTTAITRDLSGRPSPPAIPCPIVGACYPVLYGAGGL